MPNTFDERYWENLIHGIKNKRCTPFLGAGICYGVLPLGSEIAKLWSKEYGYPLEDIGDLTRVAQFLAVDHENGMFPKYEIVKRFNKIKETPNFDDENEPHRVLADLDLPLYMTTNYDDFMLQALKRKKEPKQGMSKWNKLVDSQPFIFDPAFIPKPETPVVFHLHGALDWPESLVLTEDDYLNFLSNTSEVEKPWPSWIEKILTKSSFLFIGYSLADWTFRVMFRSLMKSIEPGLHDFNVTVQLPPPPVNDVFYLKNGDKISGKIKEESRKSIRIETEAAGTIDIQKDKVEYIINNKDDNEETKKKNQDYLGKYFKKENIQVYWGDAKKFAMELRKRLKEFSNDK